MSPRVALLATAVLIGLPAMAAVAQTTGQIVGAIVDSTDGRPLADAEITTMPAAPAGPVLTGDDGQFVIAGLAPGLYAVLVRRIGYQAWERRGVQVHAGLTLRLRVALQPQVPRLAPIDVVTEAPRPLLTPDVTGSRQVVTREELRATPIASIAQALELRTGVSDGHFRGGRIGQETYVIDGIDVKDQFAASRSGAAFQLAPSAVQEVSVFTSGFTADQGTAVSGVVNLVTRSGPRDRWIGRAEWVTDEWAGEELKRGHNRGGLSAGGPLPLLRPGSTLFADLAVFGEADQDPRVRGLACLPVEFRCPGTRAIIPHQRGDRYFAFGKVDLPLADGVDATLSLSRNRDQHELYSTRFKYALRDYLAERQTATLVSVALNATLQPRGSRAIRLTPRLSFARIDRFLGVPDTTQGTRLGRFLLKDLRFRGEAYARLPAAEQIASGRTVPGYVQSGDSGLGSPYGVWGADLFVTDGTSGVAEWSRTDFLDLKAEAQVLVSPAHDLKVGGDLKLYHIRTYQHVAAALAGAAPAYVGFYPRTLAAYFHNTLHAADAATIDLGMRVEAYQPRLAAPTDRRDLGAPVASTRWRTLVAPRVGFAIPLALVGIERAAIRWNFGLFSQPPDFQFFFDQALDDSLNTTVRRQGNPNLGFERAIQYEGGIEYLLSNDVVFKGTGFLKDLTTLTTSGIAVGTQTGLFTNFDFGRVAGGEARVEARLPGGRWIEIGYALQRALGVVSSAFDSTASGSAIGRIEVPLQFDQRHAIDLNARWPLPLGARLAIAGTAGSGLPIPGAADERLPWTVHLAARVTREVRIGRTALQVLAEGRNVLNRPNLRTARAGGSVLPNLAALEQRARTETAGARPIPRESPLYLPGFDTNHNNVLEPAEQTAARRAALLDFYEPTMLYGEARQMRIGMEWSF